ncbi:carboxylesterase family protein [Arenivirga flava]|uniref:Carboxylic ester hydrolase n=1 Tax=Arenivirga flava TaxID=1930060 RepID=A0AA37UG77_9MICO|nr:carboxylesterase family protein [Arenivirga flava]GMA28780.1 para-nitrobenzyl esterase [Arenivirga flava]
MTAERRIPPRGLRVEGVDSWLGIEFATSERFAGPRLLDLDLEPRYDVYGAAPYQVEDPNQPLGAAPAERSGYLNVWAPADRDEAALPVIVNVYGGGFEHGSGSSWVADGSLIAATGRAVVVSFNYRVGALGFLTLDHLGHPAASNLGLRDVIAALEWVRREIDRFGGDADAVTVVGESAGGFLATALAAAPAARGLFARLAIFSAGASRILPLATARAMGDGIRAALAPDDPARLLEVDAAELVAAQGSVLATDIGVRNGPVPRAFGVVDDHEASDPVLSGHPARAVRDGALARIPLLVSSLQDEIALFREMAAATFDPSDVEAIVQEVVSWGVEPDRARGIVDEVAREHPGTAPGPLRAAVLSDYIYRLPAARLASAQSAAGGTAYLQMIGTVDGVPAGHALDVPALIGKHWPEATPAAIARDERIAAALLDFATQGDPGWAACPPEASIANGVGELRQPAGDAYAAILRRWDGVERP